MSEQLVWKRKPSQLVNLPVFVTWTIVFFLILILMMTLNDYNLPYSGYINTGLTLSLLIPIIIMIKKYLDVYFRTYYLTSERFRKREGILSKRIDEIELYRINDSVLYEPFWLRIFGLGNVVLFTSDLTDNTEYILGIPNGMKVKDAIRHYVEKQRMEKSISELDVKQHKPHKNQFLE